MEKRGKNSHPSAASVIIDSAARGIDRVEKGGSLDDYLDHGFPHAQYRRTVSDILFGYYRNKKAIDALLASLMKRPPEEAVLNILRVTTVQILFQDGIAPQSAVNVAVEAVKKESRAAAGFANAVLRKVLACKDRFHGITRGAGEILPDALLAAWKRYFSAEEVERLAALQQDGDRTLTLRTVGGSRIDAEKLSCHPLDADRSGRYFRCDDPAAAIGSPELADGSIYIQDLAASAAVGLADFSTVRKALDMCAAPGGKSMLIYEALGEDGKLVANDRSAKRQELTGANFRKYRVAADIRSASISELLQEYGTFDLVLCDVPCSNTGVFRHRPDALWRYDVTMLSELTALQLEILDNGAGLTAPGGQLIYSTCSIDPHENKMVVDTFLAGHPEFIFEKDILLLPTVEHDGAYGAKLLRK